MAKYRHALPQLSGKLFLTDGGIETTLIFHEGLTLPYFAAFDLLQHAAGRAHCASISAPMPPWPGSMLSAAFWRARPGGPVRIGARNSAMPTPRWSR